jgi:hypothetical protein
MGSRTPRRRLPVDPAPDTGVTADSRSLRPSMAAAGVPPPRSRRLSRTALGRARARSPLDPAGRKPMVLSRIVLAEHLDAFEAGKSREAFGPARGVTPPSPAGSMSMLGLAPHHTHCLFLRHSHAARSLADIVLGLPGSAPCENESTWKARATVVVVLTPETGTTALGPATGADNVPGLRGSSPPLHIRSTPRSSLSCNAPSILRRRRQKDSSRAALAPPQPLESSQPAHPPRP